MSNMSVSVIALHTLVLYLPLSLIVMTTALDTDDIEEFTTDEIELLTGITDNNLGSTVSTASSPIKSTVIPVPHSTNVAVGSTPAIVPSFEPIAMSTVETTTMPVSETTAVHTVESPTLEPSIENQTSEGFVPLTSSHTSDPRSLLTPKQTTTSQIFTSEPTSSTPSPGTTGTTTEKASNPETTTTTSTTHITPVPTTVTAIPQVPPIQTTFSAGSTSTSANPSRQIKGNMWVIIFIALVAIAFVLGIIFMFVCFNNRRRSRSENFSSSFRNGGSKKSKKKKGTEEDAWAGPVALNKEREGGEGEEEGVKEEDRKGEGDGAQVVLSTFIAAQNEEEKERVNGGCAEAKEGEKNAEELPLLFIDEGREDDAPSLPPPSSSLPPPQSKEEVTGEKNGGPAFCLTTAV